MYLKQFATLSPTDILKFVKPYYQLRWSVISLEESVESQEEN
jgi:hypothetical protein